MKGGFVSYDISTGEVYGPSQKDAQAEKRVRDVDGIPTTVTFEAVPVTFPAGVVHVDLLTIWQD